VFLFVLFSLLLFCVLFDIVVVLVYICFSCFICLLFSFFCFFVCALSKEVYHMCKRTYSYCSVLLTLPKTHIVVVMCLFIFLNTYICALLF